MNAYQVCIDTQSSIEAKSSLKKSEAHFVSCLVRPKQQKLIQQYESDNDGVYFVIDVNSQSGFDDHSLRNLLSSKNVKAIKLNADLLSDKFNDLDSILKAVTRKKITVEVEYNHLFATEICMFISKWTGADFVITLPSYRGYESFFPFSLHIETLQKLSRLQNVNIKLPEISGLKDTSGTQVFTLYSSMLLNLFGSTRCMFASYGADTTPSTNPNWLALRDIIPIAQFQDLKWKTANRVYRLGIPSKQ